MIWIIIWFILGLAGSGIAFASMQAYDSSDPVMDWVLCVILSICGPIMLVFSLSVHGVHWGWRLWP